MQRSFTTDNPSWLSAVPEELLLYIFSFLDIPDLSALSVTSRYLSCLVSDPLLHRTRILIVAPSRVSHSLFASGPRGAPLRPSVPDLVNRNVLKGLNIDRLWRIGAYIYSPVAVKNYEIALRLQRHHAADVLTSTLRSRPHSSELLSALHATRVLPDVESAHLSISRTLLPIVRQLKWSIRKDGLARRIRAQTSNSVLKSTDNDYPPLPVVSNALAATVRQLQWSLRRDTFARMVRHRVERSST